MESSRELRGMFKERLPLIKDLVTQISKRKFLSHQEMESFLSFVFLRIIQDDYAVLRRFTGSSSLRTYLNSVIHFLLLDYRARKWGKWRASTVALRLGSAAVQLEQLIHRDGLAQDEAIESLLRGPDRVQLRNRLEAIAARLPNRLPKTRLGLEALTTESSGVPTDHRCTAEDRLRILSRARRVIGQETKKLQRRDRLLVILHFQRKMSVAQISRLLGVDQRQLYRRLGKVLRGFRRQLRSEGISADDGKWLLPSDTRLHIIEESVR